MVLVGVCRKFPSFTEASQWRPTIVTSTEIFVEQAGENCLNSDVLIGSKTGTRVTSGSLLTSFSIFMGSNTANSSSPSGFISGRLLNSSSFIGSKTAFLVVLLVVLLVVVFWRLLFLRFFLGLRSGAEADYYFLYVVKTGTASRCSAGFYFS